MWLLRQRAGWESGERRGLPAGRQHRQSHGVEDLPQVPQLLPIVGKGASTNLIIWVFWSKTLQNCIIFNQLNLSPAMSPLRHRSVFGAKSSKRPTPKSSFFRVRRQTWCLSLQIRSFLVEIGLQTLAVLWIPFSARKQANSTPPSLSPLVTLRPALFLG